MINTHTHTCTVPAYKTAQVAGTPVRAHTARPHRWQVCRSGKDTHIQSLPTRPHRSGKDKYSTNLWPTWSLATTFRGSNVNVWDRRFRRSQWPTCNLIHILTTISKNYSRWGKMKGLTLFLFTKRALSSSVRDPGLEFSMTVVMLGLYTRLVIIAAGAPALPQLRMLVWFYASIHVQTKSTHSSSNLSIRDTVLDCKNCTGTRLWTPKDSNTGFNVLVRVGHSIHEFADWHCMLPCALEQVAHTGCQLSHLLLPEQIKHVLVVLAKTTVFV